MAASERVTALLDPDLREAALQFPSMEFTAEALPALRAMIAERRLAGPAPVMDGVSMREHRVVRKGSTDVRVLHYRPASTRRARMPAILHIHGGGYILGAPEMSHASNVALVRDLQCQIVSVDYRLAPEAPYPAAIDDCTHALDWLFEEADELGIDRGKVAVRGESAGGGLAAALVLRDRDQGNNRIAFQQLISPMLDDRTGLTMQAVDFAGAIGWSPSNNRFGWTCLLGHDPGASNVSPYAAAARADEFHNLPPTYISVGMLDLFFSESLEYVRRLYSASISTEFHVYPGAFHGFDIGSDTRVAVQSRNNAQGALDKFLRG